MYDVRKITHRDSKGRRYPMIGLPSELTPADVRNVRLIPNENGFEVVFLKD